MGLVGQATLPPAPAELPIEARRKDRNRGTDNTQRVPMRDYEIRIAAARRQVLRNPQPQQRHRDGSGEAHRCDCDSAAQYALRSPLTLVR